MASKKQSTGLLFRGLGRLHKRSESHCSFYIHTVSIMESLGNRQVDIEFPFHRALQVYTRELSYYRDFIKNAKRSCTYKQIPYGLFTRPLNKCQLAGLELVKKAVKDYRNNINSIVSIEACGGMGKSTLFFSIAHYLTQVNINFVITCPIAHACQPFGAVTVHNLLGLYNVKQKYESMVKDRYSPFVRDRIRKLDCVLIDEIFLLHSKAWSMMLRRLNYIRGTNKEIPLLIITSGDSGQLHMPMGYPLNAKVDHEKHCEMVIEGLRIFQSAKYKITLRTNQRQLGDKAYMNLLSRMHENATTHDDIKLLSTRLVTNLSDSELERFWEATHIFYSNNKADFWNQHYLLNSPYSVRSIKPKLEPYCDICAKEYPSSFLGRCVGCCITRNLIVASNLVNGSNAICDDLYFKNESQLLPEFVALFVTSYTGPRLENKTVPIFPFEEVINCPHLETKIKVLFFPIKNNYGITVYKCQGKTLDKAVVDLDGMTLSSGAIYTALSRCTSLNNVLLHSKKPIDFYFQKTVDTENGSL